MKRIVTTALFSLLSLTVYAQNPVAQREAIDKLSFLEGEWSGEAWVMTPDGSRIELEQTEKVTRRVGGQALTFEGTGRDKATGEVAFEAFATVFQNSQTGEYRMYGGTSDGRNGDLVLELIENGVQWWPKGMKQNVRYTITMTDAGAWFETGEYSADGENWTQFFEMTVTKKD